MIKTILVHLDNGESCQRRLDAAFGLAQTHDAHVAGFYPLSDYLTPLYIDAPVPSGLYQIQREQALAAAKKNEQWFGEQLRRGGVNGDWQSVENGGDVATLAEAAGCADLLVMSQSLEHDPLNDDAGLTGAVILRSPAPVLVIPEQGAAGPIGRRVMIAWNDSREAARAVADALPMLSAAEQVYVATVTADEAASGDEARGRELVDYLALHEVRAELENCQGSAGEAGAKLLGLCASHSCDLLVSGGYGHSRLREIIMGGVTRYLLRHATVPMLMSH